MATVIGIQDNVLEGYCKDVSALLKKEVLARGSKQQHRLSRVCRSTVT